MTSKTAEFGRESEELDIVSEVMRPCDLIIRRDVLPHLPNEMVLRTLENFSRSAHYLMATSFSGKLFRRSTCVYFPSV